MFAGVGAGIIAAGTLVPVLLRFGLVATWLGLCGLALALTLAAWRCWPDDQPLNRAGVGRTGVGRPRWPILAVTLVYALAAVGLLSHMVFFVDFVARGLE